METLIPIIIEIIKQYGYVIVFFGTIFAGEIVVLAAVFLATLNILNIYLVILFSLAGVIVADNLWYLVGTKLKIFLNYFKKYFGGNKYQKKLTLFGEKFHNNYRYYLVMSKFIYGFRILTVLTSGYQKIPYKKFLVFNLIGTVSEMTIIVFFGYFIGISWTYLGQYSGYARYYALFGLLILFVIRYLFKRLNKS